MKESSLFDITAYSGKKAIDLVTNATLVFVLLLVPLAIGPGPYFDPGSVAMAAQGDNGGNGGGGKNNQPDKGDLYGDVVYLLRDEFGIPIVANGCVRPLDNPDGKLLALNADDPNPDSGIQSVAAPEDYIDRYNDCGFTPPDLLLKGNLNLNVAEAEDDTELEACDPISECVAFTHEVELGRLSVLRSPPSVVEKALNDANMAISGADTVGLDWGGRLYVDESSLDSPLVNLAMMREFLDKGFLAEFDPVLFALEKLYSPDLYNANMAAAFGLGAGDDKEGMGIDSEVVLRVHESLKLGLEYYLDQNGSLKWGTPPQGSVYLYRGYHVDFGPVSVPDESTFLYDRAATYPGNFMYDEPIPPYPRFCESVMDAVFNGVDRQASGLEGYALAANDARKVLLFVHDGMVFFADSVFEFTPFEVIEKSTGYECP